MYITIDRIEGDFAVAEMPDKSLLNIPKAFFEDAKEGDVFRIEKDDDEKKIRQARIKKLSDKLFK